MAEAPRSSSSTPRRRGGVFSALKQLAESVGEVVASAGELLIDNDLRRCVRRSGGGGSGGDSSS